jgi:ABC-type dipeptide/oligopeptide/nickel transport system permease component
VTIYLAILTMLINLTADVLYSFVDPRIQLR